MKKKTAAFVMAALMCVTATGCAKEEETVSPNADVIEATSAVKSYTGMTELGFSAVSGDTKISMGTEGEIALQDEPFFADLNVDIYTQEGENDPDITNTRMILETKDDINTVYLFSDEKWYKETVEADDFRTAASQYDVMENGLLLLEYSPNIQKFGTDTLNGQEVSVYEGTIPQISLSDVMELMGVTSLVGTNIGAKYYANCSDLPVTVWVDSENVIVGYKMDVTEVVQNLFNELYSENNITDESQMIKFETYTTKATVISYNDNVDNVVPDEALSAETVESSEDLTDIQ